MLIDATNIILGRLGSVAAKAALLGENVDIINCEKAVVTGNKKTTLGLYKERLNRGSIKRGPFLKRKPNMFVKRAIRGMLPYNKENGKKALKKIKCYIGVPENLKDKKPEQIRKVDTSKLNVVKYITVKQICNMLGEK